ncbi:MAG: SHOCT domain-containing protein [Trichococcus sp.]|uniref:SHOCT domain-containing protein n=1 Tax=Trichococcus sp. TaxID=1985464 RepID=UPI003C619433
MHPFYGAVSEFFAEGYWWVGLLSMVLYLFFWAVVIVFAVKLFKKYFADREIPPKIKEDSALTILRERYARGEIDAEEFKQKKSDLLE